MKPDLSRRNEMEAECRAGAALLRSLLLFGRVVDSRLVLGGRERFASAPSELSVLYRSLPFFLGVRTVLNVAEALIKSISSNAT